MIKELVLAFALTSYAVPAIADQTFDEEMNKEYRPIDPLTSYHTKSESNWTSWNTFWFASAIGGQAADVVSTQSAINRGCSEANPIYGSDPNIGVMILVKAAILGGSYYITEYWYEGHEDQQSLRNWMYGAQAVTGFLAGGWNMNQSCEGVE